MWPNPQETADLVTFTEEIPYWKTSFFVQCILTIPSAIFRENYALSIGFKIRHLRQGVFFC